MPGYKTHLGIGFLFLIVFSFIANINFQNFAVFFIITLIYSLLPDIDVGNSKAGRSLRIILSVFALILLSISLFGHTVIGILGLSLLILLTILQFVKHRKFIHTIRAAILFSLPLLVIGIPESIFGLVCYLLHLFFDKSFKL